MYTIVIRLFAKTGDNPFPTSLCTYLICMENYKKFLHLFKNDQTFMGFGEYFNNDDPPERSFPDLLNLDKDNLKTFTKDALEFLEDFETATDLKWGYRAYSQFQDILGISITSEENVPILQRHYCYYESLVYLRESIVAWLDQNILAALTLLRPFLELSCLHLYWYLRHDDKEYTDYYKWLDGKKDKPPFRNMVEYIFQNLPTRHCVSPIRLKKMQDILLNIFKSISAYNHTPKLEESVVSLGGRTGMISLQGFLIYLSDLTILLRQLIYLYMLVYPMSIFPIDRYKKWGFSGPMGLMFDPCNYAILRKYIGKENIEKMQNEFQNQEVEDLLTWMSNEKDITDLEFEASWQEFLGNKDKLSSDEVKTDTREHKIALHKSFLRALGWTINYVHTPINYDALMSDDDVDRIIKRLSDW